MPIRSIADSDTKRIWNGLWAIRLPVRGQLSARRALRLLNNAETQEDLRSLSPVQIDSAATHFVAELAGDLSVSWRLDQGDAWCVRVSKPHR